MKAWGALALALFVSAGSALQVPPYKNPSLPIGARVRDLLSRMTLDEKIGQMTQADRQFLTPESDIETYFLGSLLSGGGSAPPANTPTAWAEMYDSYQQHALSTRLAIPLIYGIDAVHAEYDLIKSELGAGNALTHLPPDPDPGVGTLSRSAGEGLCERAGSGPSPALRERGYPSR